MTKEPAPALSSAAFRALRGLEQTAIMLEKQAPEIFPEVNDQGQVHFGRAVMESAAQAIREAWAQAIKEVADSDDRIVELAKAYFAAREAHIENHRVGPKEFDHDNEEHLRWKIKGERLCSESVRTGTLYREACDAMVTRWISSERQP
jgi:hypothetical protein